MTSRVDTTPQEVEPESYSLPADWLGFGHKGRTTMQRYTVLRPFHKSRQTGDNNRFLRRVDTALHDGVTII